MIHTVIIPAILTFAPWLVVRYVLATNTSRRLSYRQAAPYLWASAALWVVAMNLPVVPINDQTLTFGMHFTGGVVACVLYYFVVKAYALRFSVWWHAPVLFYFFVSGLGVANELLELLLNQTGIAVLDVHQNDTWWDLTANTSGGGSAFICVEIFRKLAARKA